MAALAVPAIAATTPRPSPEAYPAHEVTPDATVAAEYFGRNAATSRSDIFTGDYLAVEVAFFPAPGRTVRVNPSDLRLYINGSKTGLVPQSSSIVAGMLRYYGREYGASTDVKLGPVFLPGNPREGPRFPGDPSDRPRTQPRAPAPDQNPDGSPRYGQDAGKQEPEEPSKALPPLDLGSGEMNQPVSGYLYFYWRAHTKKIRSMELRWEPVAGEPARAVLKLVSKVH